MRKRPAYYDSDGSLSDTGEVQRQGNGNIMLIRRGRQTVTVTERHDGISPPPPPGDGKKG